MTAIPAPDVRRTGVVQGLALLLPCTMAVMGTLVLAPVLPKLMIAFAAMPQARFWVPSILTTPALCLVFFSPLAGALGDRFGRRRLLVGASIAYAAFGVAPIWLDNLYWIILTRIGVGLCEATVLTLSTALIGDLFNGAARERWLASQTAVASISAILCLLAAGALGARFGWRGPFALYGLAVVLAGVVARVVWEPEPPQRLTAPSHSSRLPWAKLSGICAISVLGSILFYTIQIQMSVALDALGVRDPARIGGLIALASLGVPIGTVIFPLVARRPIALLLAAEFLVLGGAYGAMGQMTQPGAFVVAAGVSMVGAGMIFPTLLTWALRQLPTPVRGLGTGIWQGVFSGGQFLGGLLIAQLSVSFGGILPALGALGGIALVAGVFALLAQALVRRPG